MKRICAICGKKFRPGYNGTLDPVACDACQGIERVADYASRASAWLPDETYHEYMNCETGEIVTITRNQAFGRKK